MSVDCYFFIEVKDAEGKWHLVKWFADQDFDKFCEEDALYSFESETEIDGKKHVVKRELWTGLQWRDELGWGRSFDRTDIFSTLPDDVSEELDTILKKHSEWEIKHRRELYGKDDYTYDYKKKYGYIYLDDMWKICGEKMEEWKKNLLNKVRNIQLDEINDKLEDLKKLIQGKEIKKKKKVDDDEYEEETLDYYFDEALEDVIYLRMETKMISTITEEFTGNRWLKSENVRVIYYFS